jgi:stage III sporulation protein AG
MAKNDLFGTFAEKLKKNKKLETIVYIILILAVAAIFLSTLIKPKEETPETEQSGNTEASQLRNEQQIEGKLRQVLSSIRGAGRVEVMITYETGTEIVPAFSSDKQSSSTTSDSNTSESSTTSETESKQPATVSQNGGYQPIVLTEKQPVVRGVIVVAEGAADIMVKLDLQLAVQTVLDVDADCIEVFEMSTFNEG